MTLDSHLFSSKKKLGSLPLYEGKMIHQYHSNFGLPNYFIKEDEAKEILLNKEMGRIKRELKSKNFSTEVFERLKFKQDYEVYKLVYREIASSTNERTLIATLLPNRIFTGNKLHYFVNFSYEKQGDKIIQNQVEVQNL